MAWVQHLNSVSEKLPVGRAYGHTELMMTPCKLQTSNPNIRFLRKIGCLLIWLALFVGLSGCRAETPPPPTITVTAVAPLTSTPLAAVATATSSATPLPPPPTATTTPAPSPTATPLYTGPPLDPTTVGVQVHIHREDLPAIIAHLQALGVGWVKTQVSWKLYQPGPARYDDFHFAELDELVELAHAAGLQVLLGVSKAPEWSRPTTELDGPPADDLLFQEFMAYLAARYRGRVAAYELWNEPNLQREWHGAPLSAADLVALMTAGAAGVRLGDPAAQVVSAAPAPTGINDGVTAVDDRQYFRQMLQAGMANVVDGIGVHPYGWANSPDSSATDPGTSAPSHNNHPSFFFADTLRDYRAILAEFGSDQPLWITEFGWATFENVAPAPPAGGEFMAYVNEWQQAAYIVRAIDLAQQWHAAPLILWNLNFGPLLGSDYLETGYSILHPDGTPRPAYLLLQAALAPSPR